MKKVLLLFIVLTFTFLSVNAQTPWYLTGNAGTDPSSNFIGTTDAKPLIFKTWGAERMRLLQDIPFLGIGVVDPQATLHLHNSQTMGQLPLLRLSTNATTNRSNNGFCVYSDLLTKDFLFKKHEEAKFFLEGPGGGFVIAQDGNIGFGTDASKQKVHINEGNLIITTLSTNLSDVPNGALLFSDVVSSVCHAKWGIKYHNSNQGSNNEKGLNFRKYCGRSENGNHSVLFLSEENRVGVGTINPQTTLDVAGVMSAQSANIAGLVKAKEIKVTLSDWPDFVFINNYNLMPLNELEQFVTENHHLPNVPSAADVEANGIELGAMNATLLEKIEELTLYIIDLQKQINELKTTKIVVND
jgi:hypothetical protein